MKLIENNIQKIVALCKKYKVNKLFVFGSILTDRFNDDSVAMWTWLFLSTKQKLVIISTTTLISNTRWRNCLAGMLICWKNRP